MKFVEGVELAREIRALICDTPNVVIATAFVGVGFDALIGGRAKRFPPVVVRCNLHMGGTNPAPLQALLRSTKPRIRLTSCNRLHAKVILTEKRAIVSSANLSRNGVGAMGAAQSTSDPAHQEAGTVITDRGQIKAIRRWLNTLDGRTISSPDDEELLAAAELFRLRSQWDRPFTPSDGTSDQIGFVRQTLLDPESAALIDHCTVVISCCNTTRKADKQARDMQLRGYPVTVNEFFEDFKAVEPGSTLVYFTGSEHRASLHYREAYRMRRDKWAVQSNPATGKRCWLQFVEPFGVPWLPANKQCKTELNALVKTYVTDHHMLKQSWQFPLRDLVAELT